MCMTSKIQELTGTHTLHFHYFPRSTFLKKVASVCVKIPSPYLCDKTHKVSLLLSEMKEVWGGGAMRKCMQGWLQKYQIYLRKNTGIHRCYVKLLQKLLMCLLYLLCNQYSFSRSAHCNTEHFITIICMPCFQYLLE